MRGVPDRRPAAICNVFNIKQLIVSPKIDMRESNVSFVADLLWTGPNEERKTVVYVDLLLSLLVLIY